MVVTVAKKIVKSLLPDFFNTPGLSEKVNHAIFILSYKNKAIGFLEYKNDMWFFQYSEDYIKNKFVEPLMDFPIVEKKYQFKELPPFFAARIPKINQPFHKKKLLKYNGSKDDIVSLLEIFGVRSINNPFELKKKKASLTPDFS